jgi:hypothetical protein
MTKKSLINDWKFDKDIENAFNEWFYSNHTDYSFKSEHFYVDCDIGDVKTRQSMLQKWIYASFYSGYNIGRLSETKVGLTDNED